MPRPGITPDYLAAIQSGELLPILFVELGFVSETVRIWSGIGNITWNGHTWSGVGSLLSLPGIEEGVTVEARGVAISLSGFDATILPEILSDWQIGTPCTIYLGAFYANAPTTIIPSPLVAFSGRMDQPVVEVSGKTATITVNVETRILEMNVSVERRYTQEDQQRDVPGDQAFNWVDQIQEQTLYWGRLPTSTNNL